VEPRTCCGHGTRVSTPTLASQRGASAFLGYAGFLITGSWVRGLIVAVAILLTVRFVVGPYIVRMNPADRPDT